MANSRAAGPAEDIRTTQIADGYARGGEAFSLLSGLTVKEKTAAGCAQEATHIVTEARAEKTAPTRKGDRLASAGCTVIAAR